MEGVPPSCNEDDVNLTSNQFDFQSPEDSFNISEFLSSPPEVPGNQSFMLCNDQVGQNMVVDNNVINDSIQQTTLFPPSSPQTMMEGFQPSFMEEVDNFESLLSELEFHSPPPEVPVNQSSISCNDQGGQNSVINDSIQQTTPFPTSFPETMVESNDRFWNYVEKRDEMVGSLIKKVLKCKFCPHTFAIKTAITRIKWHLSGERGRNVAICHGVTKEVQEAAFLALCGANKRQKITASAVNVNDCGISTCPQEQNNEIENLGGGIGRVQGEVQVVEPGVGEERISSQAIAGNDEVSMTGMRAQEDGVSEGALESRPRTEPVDRSLEQSNAVLGNLAGGAGSIQVGVQGVLEQGAGEERMNRVRVRTEPVEEDVENSRRSVQVGAGARSSESLKYNKTRGLLLPLSSTKPVGQAFEENTKVIWSLLMDDKVSTIGIYGMGGVGKTTILQHIRNELLQRRDICDHVWWVTVSQDFSINRLQNLIAKRLKLDLSSEDDDLHRATKLSEELRKKQKWILILDDLWNNFELDRVGIPEKLKECKLIMTTRSEMVCHQMACHRKIKVKPLSDGEAWTLFMEKLGRDIALSREVEGIAKAVAKECAGLPLGIIAVAGSLRGVDDPHEWRNTLNKLRESEFRDIDEKVFRLLRFSYDRLGDLALKQCLLYCALFPEDDVIVREELIGYLIDEGIIKGKRSRGDAFDEGHTMLNRLENVCLLESAKMKYDDIRRVKMHDLIRDMAIRILLENSQGMVKAGAQLKELPDAEEWTENLTRVSLMANMIEEIPSSHSPRCPYLSTLLLCQNRWLGFIADSFFKQLHGLKVLDLSWTDIGNLPDSVSDLVSLTALLLNHCEKLRRVPSLEKLQALKRLSFSHTALEKIPQGMECLTNLRYLRMNGCGEKEFPSGILPKLSHLQVFVLEEFKMQDDAPITVKGKEVGSLRNLETLECHFEGFSDFVEYLRSRDGILSLSTCKILVGEVGRYLQQYIEDFPSKTVVLGNLSINGDRDFQVKFLNGIQGLHCDLIDARSLCDVLSLENATELERITILRCDNMESLVSSSWFCSAPPPLPPYNGMFSCLKEFYCHRCDNMKKLFPLVLLPNLVNLEVIDVSECHKMEEIIGTTDEESSSSNSITEVILPKLRILELFDLRELKSICSAKLICNSLEEITVIRCQKLKRMPICLPLLENGQPSPPPSLRRIEICPEEWWESVVKWEHPNTTDVLRPFVKVQGQRRKGMGIVIQNDPEKVQDAARAAIDGPPEKKQKVIAGSSNNEVNNAIPTSAQKQNYEGRHVEMAQQGEAFSPTALKDCLDSIVDKEIELSINQADRPRGDSSSPKDLSCLGLGSYHDQLCSPPAKNDVIMDDVQNIVREKTEPVANMTEQSNTILNKLAGDDGRIQVGVQGKEQGAEEELNCSHPEAESSMEYTCEGFIQQIDRNVSPERARLMENSSGRLVQTGTSASSTKLVGQAFEQNMKVIRSWLMDDEVSTIGIYGMGGVGKTTMLQHICNELLGRPGISQDVCWVTVSQDFNIKKLQNLIAKCLDLDISSEDDDMSKTVKLAKELAKKQKWILIIDDLWNSFKPQEVGIPIPLKGSKLIMTTRSEMVCRQMNSQNNIRVDPLSDEESWTLFMDKLGQDKPLSPEVEQIVVDVARECAGLPLGIVTLAKSLKGVDDLFEWRITLKRLKESNFWDMEDQIFQILRLSYDCLDDSAQQCFTYCALFDEPHKIEREVLIGSFIEEGIIKEMNNGHSILDRLEDVCLLERIDGGSAVKMHDLLRDMAMHILDEYSLIMG